MRAGSHERSRANPGQAGAGEIDQPERPRWLDGGQRSSGKLIGVYRVDPWGAAERLDKRAVERVRGVEDAIAAEWVVEPVLPRRAEEQRIVAVSVDA